MLTSSPRTIRFYRTRSGRCPVDAFLDGLSDQDARKVVWVLRLVERLERVPQQYLKKLAGTENLWEIRAQVGGRSYRFLGFFDGATLIILTNGFSKKTDKIPSNELDLAERRRRDHLKRKGE